MVPKNKIIYKHTQIGYLIIFALFVTIFLFGVIFTQTGSDSINFAIMFFTLFILASFVSLTVVIDKKYLRIKFGYGLFKKHFALKEIISARTVKNHWYCGWGIRLWLWPRMCIYNVSGYDAVEIKTKNGNTYRIGTDEPKNLKRAITQAIKQ